MEHFAENLDLGKRVHHPPSRQRVFLLYFAITSYSYGLYDLAINILLFHICFWNMN